jgi:hypothetical protein
MPKPLTTRTDHKYVTPTAENQPPLQIIENKPAGTVAAALAHGKAQVDAAK